MKQILNHLTPEAVAIIRIDLLNRVNHSQTISPDGRHLLETHARQCYDHLLHEFKTHDETQRYIASIEATHIPF